MVTTEVFGEFCTKNPSYLIFSGQVTTLEERSYLLIQKIIYFLYFGGHTQWWSGYDLALRNHFCFGNHLGHHESNAGSSWMTLCKANFLPLCYCSGPQKIIFFPYHLWGIADSFRVDHDALLANIFMHGHMLMSIRCHCLIMWQQSSRKELVFFKLLIIDFIMTLF